MPVDGTRCDDPVALHWRGLVLRFETWLGAGAIWLAMQAPANACPFCGHSPGESLGTFALLAGAFLWMRSLSRRRRSGGAKAVDAAPGVRQGDH
jgi:hypothetical protein